MRSGGTGRRSRTVGARIAARFSSRDSPARKQKKRNNALQDQPLIHDSLKKLQSNKVREENDVSVQNETSSQELGSFDHMDKSSSN